MSILRSKIWNIRERVYSALLNLQQSFAAVNSQSAIQAATLSGVGVVPLPTAFTGIDRRGMVSGMKLKTTGVANQVAIEPGVLFSWSPSYPSVDPTDATTPFRMLDRTNATDLALTVPTPPSGTQFYLLEARVGMTVTNANRDIRNPTTGIFEPTSVPDERMPTIETQWVGPSTTWPNPTDLNGWVVIGVVRRTSAGGVVASSDVYDLRVKPSDVNGIASMAAQNRQGRFDFKVATNGDLTIQTIEPAMSQGIPLERGAGGVGGTPAISLPAILDPTETLSGNAVYHLYVAPWKGRPVTRGDQPYMRGFLVMSSVAPTNLPYGGPGGGDTMELVWVNNASITMPGTSGYVAAAAGAIYVGTVFTDTAGTGFVPCYQVNRKLRVDGSNPGVDIGSKTRGSAGNSSTPWLIPEIARLQLVQVDWSATDGAPVGIEIQFQKFGTVAAGHASQVGIRPSSLNNSFTFEYHSAFDGPDPSINGTFAALATGAAPATWLVLMTPAGFDW